MIQFKTFLEAISYHTNCVICQEKLSINDRDLVDYDTKLSINDRVCKPEKISFYISQRNDDIVSLDTNTDEISFVAPEYSASHGVFIHGLTLHCEDCCQFAYNIQIHMDLGQKKLIEIFLNSESISVEDGRDLHEIKNIYAMKKTEYNYFPNELAEPQQESKYKGRIIFPLIPLNLINPMETVNRIRNLIIYT